MIDIIIEKPYKVSLLMIGIGLISFFMAYGTNIIWLQLIGVLLGFFSAFGLFAIALFIILSIGNKA
ncbi:hypothetical protein ABD92_15090 [Lysinibacillus sphaericus]|uniref:Uncharacterized protein n=1 Tax=Lysinibacillus sphaericus TaxID=1421 RepID=A0A6H0A0Z8_LYSSH|nr:hypothetical protein AR327_23370 [Lysinibacillus sphaericus]AMR93133.1 hypothetical protein A1T07_23285 [Lysinibacillus sphaericus]MBG9710685.1 hypothetical protein [Lysinibacillus sphaericus]MBG9730406.1 hypothetical protein [Lysinibacillus sphaericus]MBG9739984.1 hypothetical protein [Lysinibacillus sphaericus]